MTLYDWVQQKNLWVISWLLPVYSFLIALELVLMLIGFRNSPITLAWINHHLLANCLINICLYPALAFAIRVRNQWVSAILPYFLPKIRSRIPPRFLAITRSL